MPCNSPIGTTRYEGFDGSFSAYVAKDVSAVMQDLGIAEGDLSRSELDSAEDWSLEPEARAILLAIIRSASPHCYVEIGAHKGRTALAVAEAMVANGHGRVYALEPDLNLAAGLERLAVERDLPVVVIPLTSKAAFEEWGREAIDVLLIDGDHSFAETVFDLAAWPTLLAPEGWLLVHDTVTRLTRRFPEDYLAVPGIFEIMDIVGLELRPSQHAWEGLAILRWSQTARVHVKHRFERQGVVK